MIVAPYTPADDREYKAALRRDPCTYCGGTGGTVDHMDPRPAGGARHDWLNMTGACDRCNRRKDRGKDGGHTSALLFVLARRGLIRDNLRSWLLAGLVPGVEAYTPWGERGVVTRIEPGGVVYLRLDSHGREWRNANPLALRDRDGRRLANLARFAERS